MAVILVAVGVTAGSAPAAGQQAVSVTIGYSCSFRSASSPRSASSVPSASSSPSASKPVTARLTATFPATAKTGQPVKPTATAITVTLPPAAVAELAPLRAATITLTAELATQTTEGARSATAVWPDFTSPAATVPATRPLTLTTSGTAAPVTPGTPGVATVTAAALALVFTGRAAGHDRAPTTSLRAACVPRAGQDTTLATIAVAGSAPAGPAGHPAATPKYCQPFIAGSKLNPRFPLPKPLPGSRKSYFPEKACAYATGFTNARRLNEAALVGPGLADLVLGIPTYIKPIPPSYFYVYQRAAGRFEYHGLPVLPPAHATLLAFGFMPVSATIQLSEIGPLNVALISCGSGTKECPKRPLLNRALVYGLVSLRISNVRVNGAPLNVGAHCQTSTPFDLELTGVPPSYSIAKIHGVLTGTITIPSFSGCANGPDNLDPVFDATVSGPGNFAKVTQAVPCFISPPGPVCPPQKPIPKH